MEYIPYATQDIDASDLQAVQDVLTSGWLTQGPAVPRFESAFAERHNVAHAVAVSNATAGLHLACLALGVGPGQKVWTSTNSFVASANCALYCGADVDFVDIDPHTRNVSLAALTEKLELADKQGKLPSVFIPVHFAGLPCDLAPMRQLADRFGFKILEDASHAVGATYDGHPIGSRFADASVFSFHPVKIVTTGEGGMVTTQDEALAHKIQLLRSHGITRNTDVMQFANASMGAWYYEQQSLGYNYRLTDIHAALGDSQLLRLPAFHEARERRVARYDEHLSSLPLRLPAHTPAPGVMGRSSWHLYVIEIIPGEGVADRSSVYARLRNAGIGANVHYWPIHLQPYYRARGFWRGQFPAAETYSARALSIPLYPALSDAQQDRVVAALSSALQA